MHVLFLPPAWKDQAKESVGIILRFSEIQKWQIDKTGERAKWMQGTGICEMQLTTQKSLQRWKVVIKLIEMQVCGNYGDSD